jgi:hypothetical protein
MPPGLQKSLHILKFIFKFSAGLFSEANVHLALLCFQAQKKVRAFWKTNGL